METTRWVTTLTVVMFSASGCARLLGIDEGRLGEDGGTGGTSGTSGTSGTGGTGACDGGKTCGQLCVPIDDPAYGCAADFCEPCWIPGAVAKCSDGACAVAQCKPGFADCDGSAGNGCEVGLAIDDENCGQCKRSCGGASCVAGTCSPVVIAVKQSNPYAVAVNTTHVYWTNAGGAGSLLRLAHGDAGKPAEVEMLFSGGAKGDIALDQTHVYWADEITGKLRRLTTKSPGTVEEIGSGTRCQGVALDETYVYWTSAGTPGQIDGTVSRAPKAGGTSVVLASGLDSPWILALDTSHAYWTSFEQGSVMRVPKSGGSVQQLAPGNNPNSGVGFRGWGLAILQNSVYWLDSPLLRQIAKDGSASPITLGDTYPNSRFMTTDGALMVWTSSATTLWASLASDFGKTSPVITSQESPHGVALDGSFVYWTEWGKTADTGGVFKIARPPGGE